MACLHLSYKKLALFVCFSPIIVSGRTFSMSSNFRVNFDSFPEKKNIWRLYLLKLRDMRNWVLASQFDVKFAFS